ncbi:MAG: dUTP diphosphatase [Beijerinckiaceae bacterium]
MTLKVAITRLPHGADLPLPSYATDGAAGVDLYAAVPTDAPIVLAPLARALAPTGIIIAVPRGYEGQVRPRSGLALRLGLTVINAPGTIDSDYRGEVMAAMINLGDAPATITRAMRIAQLVIAPVSRIAWVETDNIEDTARGASGFGSTGML